MDTTNSEEKQSFLPDTIEATLPLETVIPVMQETLTVGKETVETARIYISKKVTAHQEEIKIPLTAEQYEIIHVPINQTVTTPPPAMRYEGDTTILTVIKEVLVVEKRYEIVEELHITRRITEHTETQNITLLTEEVSVTRQPLQSEANSL